MRLPQALATCSLLVTLLPLAPAQRSIPTAALQPAGHSLRVDDGEVWADSASYKARFERTGVDFTPTLGSAAPRNFPVRFVFESIRRGANVLATGTNADPRIDGSVVNIPRGRGGRSDIVERYEVRDAEIEQMFVFAARPAGRGDLVVRVRLETELAAAAGRRLAELVLRNARFGGGVRIRGVQGVDAAGAVAPGHMDFDGRYLDLVLPDFFLERATYPLVLDPVIGGIFSGGASFSDRRPDIAYDATNDFYLIVWEIHRSATDIDIWGTRLKSDNTGRSGVFVVRAPGIQSHPCIANLAATDMYMVAWQDNSLGNWDIRGRAVQVATRTLSPIVTIAATPADEITPDLAGEVTTRDDDALCVWDDERVGIRVCEIEVRSPTSVTVRAPITVAAGAAPNNDNPAIAKSGGSARRVVVTWEPDTIFLAARAYSMDLAPESATTLLPFPSRFPDVDGDGTSFCVVFQRPEAATPTLGDIWCWGVSIPGGTTQPLITRSGPSALAANPNDDESHPTITFTGNRYVAAWADREPGSTTDYRCAIQNLTPDCKSCGSRFVVTRSQGRRVDWPAVASEFSGGGRGDGAWFVFQEEELATSRSLVMVARYDAVAGGPVTSVARSCGGGGTLSIAGAFAFGEQVTFRLAGADSGVTLGLFLAGAPGARQLFPCGTCQILLGPIRFGVPVQNGGMQFTATLPCDAQLLDFDLDVQVLVARTSASPCSVYPNLGASNVLRARVRD